MAKEVFGFFDPTAQDVREYTDADFSRALRIISGDGVKALGDVLRVAAANDGLKTRVYPGGAMLRGYYYELIDDGGGAMLLSHEASPSMPRIDRVVLQLNLATSARSITLVIRKGTPATTPTPPALQRTSTVWEISLAQVRVATGAGLLTGADIADERSDQAACGLLDTARLEAFIELVNARFGSHAHNGSDSTKIAYANITGAPTSLPANGGNALTLNGRAEPYFATASALQTTTTTANTAKTTADAAKTAADQAAAAAQTAQQAANAGLKLVVSTTQPPADPNTLWVKA